MILKAILILAGGQSKRMGVDKALLSLPNTGKTLLEHHIQGAAKLNVPILIADNQKNLISKLNVTSNQESIYLIQDYQSGAGPLSAIAGAMLTSKISTNIYDNFLLVISCDTIITAEQIWEKLQSSIHQQTKDKPIHIYCFGDQTHSYPLIGLYSYAIQQPLLQYLQSGCHRVMPFVEPYQHIIKLPPSWKYLVNVNTPEQFQQACLHFKTPSTH